MFEKMFSGDAHANTGANSSVEGEKSLKMFVRKHKLGNVAEDNTPVRILVDGYYGESKSANSYLHAENLEKMRATVQGIVENEWAIDWSRVEWISVSGTWAKAIPLILMKQGLGRYIHFHLPVRDFKVKEDGTIYIPPTREGKVLVKSMKLMHDRLKEGRRANASVLPTLQGNSG